MKNIMKLIRLAIALCVSLSLISCKESPGNIPREAAGGSSNPRQPVDTIANYDSLLTLLLARQDSVFNKPGSALNVSALLSVSFDTVKGCFITVGKAAFNPDFPEQARNPARIRASKYVGERWALYLKAWHTGQKILFGQPISGTITYSNDLFSKETGDTFYQLIQIPLGSVVLE
jgi:hypothetical protein